MLIKASFLAEADGYLTVAERGRFVLGDLADAKGNTVRR